MNLCNRYLIDEDQLTMATTTGADTAAGNRSSLTTLLAWRMLGMFGRGHNGFAKFVTWVSFIGLCLGVMILTLVVTVMNGFDAELKSRLLSSIAHVTVKDGDQEQGLQAAARDMPGVISVQNYFQGVGALSAAGQVQPVSIYGIDDSAGEQFKQFVQAMQTGSLDTFNNLSDGVLIGAPLARFLGLRVGDPVVVVCVALVDGQGNGAGEESSVRPQLLRFQLAGTFELGAEPDYGLMIANLKRFDREEWSRYGSFGTQIQLSDPMRAQAVAENLGEQFGGRKIQSWRDTYGELFQAVALEKSMMFVLLLLVVAIAAFNIVAGQSMLVNDKRSNIAILRTMGCNESAIAGIFLSQGLLISATGTLLGLVLGVLAAFNVNSLLDLVATLTGMHLLDGSFFVTVPVKVLPMDLLIIGTISCGLCVLSAWLPARRAALLDPVEGLHL